jgi:hypothetical protein
LHHSSQWLAWLAVTAKPMAGSVVAAIEAERNAWVRSGLPG